MIKLNDVEIKLDKYPDGTFLFKDIPLIGPKNLIEWFFESMEEMSAIIYLTQYCKDQGTEIYLDMPYIPDARMDRVKKRKEIFTLKYFAQIINLLNFKQVEVLDPHSDVSAALFNKVHVESPNRMIETAVKKIAKPEVIGITIDEHGWANVEELIQGIAKNNLGFNKEFLEEIVRTDNKQRYSFNDDKTLIRANQGHSIPVDVELEEKEPPKILYHGTGEKYIASIDQNGLIPKSRLYVHLSKDVETAKAVGKRHGKEVVYSINSEQMYKDGYKFYLSKNGVWLTKRVPVKYLMKEV